MPDIQVLGVVPDRSVAEQVVGNLRLAGFQQDAVSIIMVTKEEPTETLDAAADDQTGEGAKEVAVSAAKGATVGATAGVLGGLATLAIPGIGPVLGTGILLGLFGGTGAIVGTLAGAFASEDVSSEVVNRYGMALREGQALVCASAPNTEMAKQAEDVLDAAGATNINSYLEDAKNITDAPGLTDVTE